MMMNKGLVIRTNKKLIDNKEKEEEEKTVYVLLKDKFRWILFLLSIDEIYILQIRCTRKIEI